MKKIELNQSVNLNKQENTNPEKDTRHEGPSDVVFLRFLANAIDPKEIPRTNPALGGHRLGHVAIGHFDTHVPVLAVKFQRVPEIALDAHLLSLVHLAVLAVICS